MACKVPVNMDTMRDEVPERSRLQLSPTHPGGSGWTGYGPAPGNGGALPGAFLHTRRGAYGYNARLCSENPEGYAAMTGTPQKGR